MIFWLGVGFVVLAGLAAALWGPWWVAAADLLIALGLVLVWLGARADRRARQERLARLFGIDSNG